MSRTSKLGLFTETSHKKASAVSFGDCRHKNFLFRNGCGILLLKFLLRRNFSLPQPPEILPPQFFLMDAGIVQRLPSVDSAVMAVAESWADGVIADGWIPR